MTYHSFPAAALPDDPHPGHVTALHRHAFAPLRSIKHRAEPPGAGGTLRACAIRRRPDRAHLATWKGTNACESSGCRGG